MGLDPSVGKVARPTAPDPVAVIRPRQRSNRPQVDQRRAMGLPRLAMMQKKRQKRAVLSLWAISIDLICICAAFLTASALRLDAIHLEQISRILICILPIYLGIALNNQGHHITTLLDGFRSAWRAGAALVFAAASLLLIAFFMKLGADLSRLLISVGTILSIGLLIIWRNVLARVGRHYLGASPFATLCLYDGLECGAMSGEGAIDVQEAGLSPDANDPRMIDKLSKVVRGMDSVVVHCEPAHRPKWAFILKSLDVPSEIATPELTALHPLEIRQRSGYVSLLLASGPMAWNERLLKRSFDLLVTLALMPIALPTLAFVAIVVKLDSHGPAFFKQTRIGLGNRPFSIMKFRTMRAESCDSEGTISTARFDQRLTRIGPFLRRTSIDELPQLLNVLVGDMSLVGPRPHARGSRAGKDLFWDVDRRYWHRHVVKPGITGLAQVRGHRGNTFQEQQLRDRLDADLEYVANWTLMSDIKILLRTAYVLFDKNAF